MDHEVGRNGVWRQRDERRLRVLSVAGTRPEAIKLAPFAMAAQLAPNIDHRLIGTGQHDGLFEDALACFGLAAHEMLGLSFADLDPDSAGARLAEALPSVFDRLLPDLVVVQGDTTSAWGTALATRDQGVPLAHVEAGLRSGDPALPWPEERNRREIDAIADLLFAPSEQAATNLREERVSGRIIVTGNTGIDALLMMSSRTGTAPRAPGRHRILVTCHRRENAGPPMERICAALRLLARRHDVEISVTLHPNPVGRAMQATLAEIPSITILPALDYREMVALLKGTDLVLSDSGGLQEECPALGIPLLVLRDNTERPEAIEEGSARLVGTDTSLIVRSVETLLDDPAAYDRMAQPRFPFGEGQASSRIVDVIARFPFPRR